jgi:DNA-binding MarR family transcriptional regulator
VGELAEYLLIRHNSAVELLDRLEKRGLAFRERLLEDRRQARVRLSPGGCEILERLTADHREELGSLAPHLIEALNRALTIQNEENNSAEEGNVPASPHRRK